MTIVFVHGVPVTPAVWTPLISELPTSQQQDVVRLSPPGFGATFLDYRDWLIGELSQLKTPGTGNATSRRPSRETTLNGRRA